VDVVSVHMPEQLSFHHLLGHVDRKDSATDGKECNLFGGTRRLKMLPVQRELKPSKSAYLKPPQ